MPTRAYFLLFEVGKITLLHINSKSPHNFLKHHGNIVKHACMLSRFSHVQLCATPWTVACQAHLSMEFSREEYWSGQPFTSPGDLPNPGTERTSLMSPVLAGTTSATWEAHGTTPTWSQKTLLLGCKMLKTFLPNPRPLVWLLTSNVSVCSKISSFNVMAFLSFPTFSSILSQI